MLRGRVSEDIYVFTSELYAQVNAGAIITPEGAILVDTLPFPSESRQLASFVRQACEPGVQYIILTHYHADHSYGAYLFPKADIVAHAKCEKLLKEIGAPALKKARAEEPELEEVVLRLPDVTFEEGEIAVQVGGKIVRLMHSPGHTEDSIMAYVENDRVLFAADTIMPVPSIVDGDVDALRSSLKKVTELPVENLVQGHGEVILRGEVNARAEISLQYLDKIEAIVEDAIENDKGREALKESSIESCGLSRIPLNGLVQQIHVANLLDLYDRKTS